MKNNLYIILIFLSSFSISAQYTDSNSHIGIAVGYSKLDIITDAFELTPLGGWNAGFTTRGMMYNKFDLVYGIDFHQSKFSVPGRFLGTSRLEDIEYQLTFVQIQFLGSYRAISNHLNFDFGPVFQLNDRLKVDDTYNRHVLEKTSLKANEIVDVSKFNVFLGAGVTGGFEHVRASIFYQYGLNNFFAPLNKIKPVTDKGLDLKAHASLLTAKIIFYL